MIRRAVQIRCDGYDELTDEQMRAIPMICDYWRKDCRAGSSSVKYERAMAAEEGWTRVGKKDYCPACTARKAGGHGEGH